MSKAAVAPRLDFWHDADLGGPSLVRARYRAHEFERHVHDELVIAVTEEGGSRCRAPGVADMAGPGTLWVSGVGEYHSGTVEPERHWNYRAIYLDEAALKSTARVFHEASDRALSIRPGIYHDPPLARLLIEAHRRLEAGAPLIERQTLWWSALGLLFGRYGEPRLKFGPAGLEGTKIAAVRDYIAENFACPISIDDLAAVAGLSRYYFMRSFRRACGVSPHAYVNQVRLIAAKRLLAAGEAPADVATAVGLYDQSHLNRLFKRIYGITPGVYAAAFSTA